MRAVSLPLFKIKRRLRQPGSMLPTLLLPKFGYYSINTLRTMATKSTTTATINRSSHTGTPSFETLAWSCCCGWGWRTAR